MTTDSLICSCGQKLVGLSIEVINCPNCGKPNFETMIEKLGGIDDIQLQYLKSKYRFVLEDYLKTFGEKGC